MFYREIIGTYCDGCSKHTAWKNAVGGTYSYHSILNCRPVQYIRAVSDFWMHKRGQFCCITYSGKPPTKRRSGVQLLSIINSLYCDSASSRSTRVGYLITRPNSLMKLTYQRTSTSSVLSIRSYKPLNSSYFNFIRCYKSIFYEPWSQ